jgi:Arc/MetJ family transcription regulator
MLMCMRTNIVLDDDLVREAMRHSRARTKRALVEEALVTFVTVKSAEAHRATYRERLQRLDSRLRGLRLRKRPSEVLRADRDRA